MLLSALIKASDEALLEVGERYDSARLGHRIPVLTVGLVVPEAKGSDERGQVFAGNADASKASVCFHARRPCLDRGAAENERS